MKPQFEKNYRAEKNLWGTKPSAVISENYSHFAPGTVLDLGAGDGRNALFLARKGFNVTAVDIAPTGISNLIEKAAEAGVEDLVNGIVADIRQFEPNQQYDNVISNFTLHFVGSENIRPCLDKMAAATKAGGINVVDDFTANGPFGKNDPESYVTPEVLREYYGRLGWQVESLQTRMVNTMQFESPGKPLQHEAVAIVARKSA